MTQNIFSAQQPIHNIPLAQQIQTQAQPNPTNPDQNMAQIDET